MGVITFYVDGLPVTVDDRTYAFDSDYRPVSPAAFKQVSDADRVELWRTQPAIRTVTGFLARNMAQVPMHGFSRRANGDRERVDRASPLGRLLRQPDRLQTPFEWVHTLALDVCLFDRYAAQLFMQDDGSYRLLRLPPRRWKFDRDSADRPTSIVAWRADGSEFRVPLDRAFWLDGYPADVDTSPVASLLGVLQEEAQAATYRSQLWANGGRWPGWVERPLEAPDWSKTTRDTFKAGLRAFAGSGDRSGGIPIFEEGMVYKEGTVGISPESGEQLDSRKFSTAFVMAAFGVAPALLNLLDGTYANVKAFRETLYSDTLGSWFQQVQQAFNVRVLPQVADPDVEYVEFNVHEKLRLAFEDQAQIMQTLTGGPVMTRSEGRERLNLRHLPEADALIVPMNVTVGGQASPTDSGSQNREL